MKLLSIFGIFVWLSAVGVSIFQIAGCETTTGVQSLSPPQRFPLLADRLATRLLSGVISSTAGRVIIC